MSKLYDKYLFLKSNKPHSDTTLYLFKSGIFFIFLDNDALIASKLLNLKLTYLTENVLKCGFPINSLEKYTHILQKSSYDFQIIDSPQSKICNVSTDTITENIKSLLQEISEVDTNLLSVREAYDFIEKIKVSAKLLL